MTASALVLPHLLHIRVYYEDTDAAGIVYHARYLGFAERARTELLRAAAVPLDELARDEGLIFVVRRVKMDYLRPARLDELLTVATDPFELGAATTRMRQDFSVGSRAVARMEVQLACVRVADGRPARVPARWRVAFEEVRNGSSS